MMYLYSFNKRVLNKCLNWTGLFADVTKEVPGVEVLEYPDILEFHFKFRNKYLSFYGMKDSHGT